MTLRGHVTTAPGGVVGLDTPNFISAARAKQFFSKGYRFCLRYVSHTKNPSPNYTDLTESEAQGILDARLALMVVQHPLGEGWVPDAGLGTEFGQFAATHAENAGVPAGVNLWLDLEGVQAGTASSDVIAFCNAWFQTVELAGYISGIYIGANPGLTADQLYWDLKTKHYWRGGSSAASGVPADIPQRGYQMIQRIQNPGTPSEFDSNATQFDHVGQCVAWITGNTQ